jgi:hypothetical protein
MFCSPAAPSVPSASEDMEYQAAMAELEAYKASPCIMTKNIDGTDVNILTWWREIGEKRYPHIALMARQYLAVPASSAAVERIFSFAGLSYSDLRKSLHDTTLEEFMWIKWAS